MGLLDAPAPPRSSNAYGIVTRMQIGIEDSVLLILGDSTSSGTTRWAYLLAGILATRFPTHTINYRAWNDTSQAYDTAVVIRTGSGARKLDIYNGSFSGSVSTYPGARWAAIAPVTPHCVIVNYGHNNVGSTAYRDGQYTLTRQVQERWPMAGIICCAQNPRAATDSECTNDLIRQRQVMELCASEGYDCVNVTKLFLNDPNYATTLLIGDGIHPNDSLGSPLWATEVAKLFVRNVTPASPRLNDMQKWVPASEFVAHVGSPTFGRVNDCPAWSLDPTTIESIATTVVPPSHWQSWDIYVLWTHQTGSGLTAGNSGVTFKLERSNQGSGLSTPLDGTGGATSAYAVLTAAKVGGANNNGAWGEQNTLLRTNETTAARPVGYRITRLATDGGDTLAEDVNVLGMLLVRAS
jgi:hypothetical protein